MSTTAEHVKLEQLKRSLQKYKENADALYDGKYAQKAAVETLIGTDTGKSARTIANEELAAQLVPENAKESLDTLQEIAAWIQAHPDDASAMNQAITALETLVGTIPEAATASDIVGYIAEEIAKVNSDLDVYVKKEDLTYATDDDIDGMIAEIFGATV